MPSATVTVYACGAATTVYFTLASAVTPSAPPSVATHTTSYGPPTVSVGNASSGPSVSAGVPATVQAYVTSPSAFLAVAVTVASAFSTTSKSSAGSSATENSPESSLKKRTSFWLLVVL